MNLYRTNVRALCVLKFPMNNYYHQFCTDEILNSYGESNVRWNHYGTTAIIKIKLHNTTANKFKTPDNSINACLLKTSIDLKIIKFGYLLSNHNFIVNGNIVTCKLKKLKN